MDEHWQNLYSRWIDGRLSPEEKDELESYLERNPDFWFRRFVDRIRKSPPPTPAGPDLWPMLRLRLPRMRPLWKKALAAAIVVAVVLGLWYRQHHLGLELERLARRNQDLLAHLADMEERVRNVQEEHGEPRQILEVALAYRERGKWSKAARLFSLLKSCPDREVAAAARYQLATHYRGADPGQALSELTPFAHQYADSDYLYPSLQLVREIACGNDIAGAWELWRQLERRCRDREIALSQ